MRGIFAIKSSASPSQIVDWKWPTVALATLSKDSTDRISVMSEFSPPLRALGGSGAFRQFRADGQVFNSFTPIFYDSLI